MRKSINLILSFILVSYGYGQIVEQPDKITLIKYDLFSPLTGCLGFSVEINDNKFTSLDFDYGFIGLRPADYFNNDKFRGSYATLGSRMYIVKKYKGTSEPQSISGIYFKPAITLNYFNYFNNAKNDVLGQSYSVGLLMNSGYQYVFFKRLVIDGWFGFGYDHSWVSEQRGRVEVADPDAYQFKYGYYNVPGKPMIFDFGIMVGIIVQ